MPERCLFPRTKELPLADLRACLNFAEQADLRGWVVIISIMDIIRTGQVLYLHFIRIICADLGVADKGEMMFFPIKIVDF